MELRQIQYFICLYEEGSMTRAARRVHVVQPALSVQIAKLEEELGQSLFTRSARGMEPTDAARRMYELFLPLMQDFTHAREQMLCRNGEVTGRVALGMITSLAQGVLAPTLLAFSRQYPKVEVSIANGRLLEWVASGELDAALLDLPRRAGSLNVRPIVEEPLVLVCPPDGTALWSPITFEQAVSERLILTTRLHGLRDILDTYAERENLSLIPAFELDSVIATLNMVSSGGMRAILPRSSVISHLGRGGLHARSIVSPALTRQIVCVSHPRRPLNTPTLLFLDMLIAQVRGDEAPGSEQPMLQSDGSDHN